MAQTTANVESARLDLFDRVWRFATSVRLALWLIGLLAVCTFIGTLVPQATNAGLLDEVAYLNWLDFQRERFGAFDRLVTLFDLIGFFAIFQSVYFRALLVTLTVAIVLCTVNRAPGIWRGAMRLPPIRVGARLFEAHADARHAVGPALAAATALERLDAGMRRRGYRVIQETTTAGTFVYADKHRFGIFGTFVSHLGLVLLLGGALVGSVFGWRDDVFTITDGATREIGRGTGLAVRNDLFVDEYDPATGQASDFYTEAVLLGRQGDGWQEIRRHRVRVNDPMDHGGVVVHQAFFGPAAVLRVTGGDGSVLLNEGVPLPYRNMEGRPLGWVDLPAGAFPVPLTLYVVGRAPVGPMGDPAIAPGQVVVELYPTGRASDQTLLFRGLLDLGRPVAVKAPSGKTFLELNFERERQFSGMNVSYNPGLPLIWTACVLMLLGWGAVFYFPHRRVRALVEPTAGGTRVALVAISKADLTLRRELDSLNQDLAAALAPSRPIVRAAAD